MCLSTRSRDMPILSARTRAVASPLARADLYLSHRSSLGFHAFGSLALALIPMTFLPFGSSCAFTGVINMDAK